MGAELLRGESHPLTRTRLEIRVTAAVPVVVCVVTEDIRAGGPARIAHPGSPVIPGVEVPSRASATQRVVVDLARVDTYAPAAGAHRMTVWIARPDPAAGSGALGGAPAPRVTVGVPDGETLVALTLAGYDTDSAIAALEFRSDGFCGFWSVAAVGRSCPGGLAGALAGHALPEVDRLAARVARLGAAPCPTLPAQRGGGGPVPSADRPDPAEPVAGDAPGWSMEERLHNQVRGMFEDLARGIAAYRSAVDFAESRLERETDRLLADPRKRLDAAVEAARERAQARRDDLADRARALLDHDLRQLTAESEVVEPALSAPYAGWESPVWHGYQPLERTPLAVRLGDVHLPEVPELRIPMLVRLPLERGLWIDSGTGYGPEPGGSLGEGREPEAVEHARRGATEVAVALAVRLLASHPVGGLTVHLVDPAGSAGEWFAPLARSGALREWSGACGVAAAMEALIRRVDLVRMARQAGAPDALPPDLDTGTQLLVIADFPRDFDDRAITRLRYLVDEGPAAGVCPLLIADRADTQAFGPVLDPMWRSLLRLTPFPDDHLGDPWVGHAWTYEPSLPPESSRVLGSVLGRIAKARQEHGS